MPSSQNNVSNVRHSTTKGILMLVMRNANLNSLFRYGYISNGIRTVLTHWSLEIANKSFPCIRFKCSLYFTSNVLAVSSQMAHSQWVSIILARVRETWGQTDDRPWPTCKWKLTQIAKAYNHCQASMSGMILACIAIYSFMTVDDNTLIDVIKWKHFPRYGLFEWEFTGYRCIPRTKASDAELWCFLWSVPEQTVE